MKKRVMKTGKMMVILAAVTFAFASWAMAPSMAQSAEVIKWKAQGAWMPGPGHHVEMPVYFAEVLNRISGGRLVIEKMYAAGELVGAFETIPACASGKLDVVHSTMYYMVGKYPEASFVAGTQGSPIKSREELLSWWWQNLDLYNQYLQERGLNVVSFPMGPVESEALWSNKPIKTVKDFKGLRVRTTGLALDFYGRLGASAVTMPMSEVIPSLEKGVIDACEFCVPYTDYPAGIHRTCQYALMGLIHQPAVIMELFINRDSWNKLPDDLKKIVKYAVELVNMHYFTDVTYYDVITWQKMIKEGKKGGVIVTKVSPELQKAFFEVGEQMAKDWSAKDPWAKKFIDSQREYHEKYKEYMGLYYNLAYPQ